MSLETDQYHPVPLGISVFLTPFTKVTAYLVTDILNIQFCTTPVSLPVRVKCPVRSVYTDIDSAVTLFH